MQLPASTCRTRIRRFLALVTVAATACQGAPTPPEPVHQQTVMLTVTDTELRPEPLVVIPTFATVVWRNAGSQPMSIDVGGATCNDCDTVLGFEPAARGARAPAIAPGDVATLCFHEAGSFAFVARVGSTEHRGVVQVGDVR
ncbi:MAG TPA: hypothetical protein VFZ65_22035 [Planctomycetota bacterium]|nr:hypothetical protein [Planctomycetota bacterium]